MDKTAISEIHKLIGNQIRSARLSKNILQKNLAKVLGVTFQQLHKYEIGRDKVDIWRLFLIKKTLEVDYDYFFAPLEKIFLEIEGGEEMHYVDSNIDENNFN